MMKFSQPPATPPAMEPAPGSQAGESSGGGEVVNYIKPLGVGGTWRGRDSSMMKQVTA